MSKIDSEIRTIHFLHIPKTGGTSMVETARQMQRGNWGRYDGELIGVLRPVSNRRFGIRPNLPIQHTPTRWLDPLQWNEWRNGRLVFAVVRDPVDRMQSEFFCRYGNLGNRSPGKMNAVILRNQIWLALGLTKFLDAGPGHWLPQSWFLFANDGRPLVDVLICHNWLQVELDLMFRAENQLPMPLRRENVGPSDRPAVWRINRMLARWVYREDYRKLRGHWSRMAPALTRLPRREKNGA